MKTNLAAQLGAMIVAASLITSTSGAVVPQQGQQQSSPQSSSSTTPAQQTSQQGTSQQPAQQPAQQQGSVQQADQPAQGPAPIQQQDDPKVKAGSEADVTAIGNRNVGHGLNFYSLEHEIALGKQLSAEVERQAKFINDPVVVEYVNRVAQNLVRNSDAQVPFTIKVIDSDVVNAFALPGGFFYVNSGLILHADEESELAGVMAHEIAHVCARHGTKQATKGEITQAGDDSGDDFYSVHVGGVRDLSGDAIRDSDGVPAIHAHGREGSGLSGLAVHVQGGVRPERVCFVF